MEQLFEIRRRLTSFQIILSGFAGVILLGTLVLMLPLSSADGRAAPFGDALFTATSAVCVTGLVVRDTASSWTGFGQAVILCLIQIGGMGVITVAVVITLASGRNLSLKQRSTLQEAIAAPQVGGIARLAGFILRVTLAVELIGAAMMAPVFCRDYGIKGSWLAFFHSVSAFCNAGFDLLGTAGKPFVSLTGYGAEPVVNGVVMALIITGGIGFLTWDDIRVNGRHLKRYRMQSKVIMSMTGILILAPFLYFYLWECEGMEGRDRVLVSLFQAVTPRTAGFNTADLAAFSGAGQAIVIVLMLIGGSPGSTAGGMKTTTLAVLCSSAVSVFRRRDEARLFRRRLETGVLQSASALLMMYVTLFLVGGLVISMAEQLPMSVCLFEAASAIGTVGLTLGITPQLGIVSRGVLIALMFCGRVGGLTILYAASPGKSQCTAKLPQEKIMVG